MGISVLSIILVLYHPSLVIIQGGTIYPGVTAWSQGEQLLTAQSKLLIKYSCTIDSHSEAGLCTPFAAATELQD